jgi:hypothetical protein
LSDLILHAVVAAGFLPDFVIQAGSLRCSSLDRAKLSFVGLRKLRSFWRAKSLNLGTISLAGLFIIKALNYPLSFFSKVYLSSNTLLFFLRILLSFFVNFLHTHPFKQFILKF